MIPIPASAPTVVQPVAPKTFPHLWIYGVQVLAPTADTGRISIETLPYDFDTKEILPQQNPPIATDELWLAVAEVPEVRQAMGAILMAVPALEAWIAARAEQKHLETIAAPEA